MEEKKNIKSESVHNVIRENRESLSISGVEDVETFNEEKVVLITQMGALSVEGSNLHINKLSVETGELQVEGEINSIIYLGDEFSNSKQGFFARLFQ